MRKLLTILALATVAHTGAARADETCFVPMSDWQPRAAVEALAVEKGWNNPRIRIDDGCYEVSGTDAEGRKIEATVHPATLEVIRTELKEDEHD